jgi:hypothetical protein
MRKRSGSGAFHDIFLQFDNAQDGERDLFLIHQHHLVGVLAAISKALLPDFRNREAVGQARAGFGS